MTTSGQTFRNTLIILLTLLAAYITVVSIRIIIVLFVAILTASAVRPVINWLVARRMPRVVAIVLVYFVLATSIIILGVVILPPIVNQLASYLENENRLAYRIIAAQRWFESLISDVTKDEVASLVAPDEIRAAVTTFITQFRNTMPSMLNNISATVAESVLIFVMGAYWLTSHTKVTDFIAQVSPPKYRENAQQITNDIEVTLGSYIRGIVVISVVVGVLNFAGMLIGGIPNAATLAFITGIASAVPMVGGLIGSVFAILLTLVVAPQYVLGVIAITFVVQQIEAYVVGPRIMANSVGLDPLLILVYTSIGFVIFGLVGALIAVPIMGAIHILIIRLVIEPHKDRLKQFRDEGGIPVLTGAGDKKPDNNNPQIVTKERN
ncbi:AI-2E family transporter [Anaerolineales bacterium]